MRPLTTWLEYGYCSITVTNHQLITVIRFVVKSYTHSWRDFANRLHLILHACEIFFSKNIRTSNASLTKQGLWIFQSPGINHSIQPFQLKASFSMVFLEHIHSIPKILIDIIIILLLLLSNFYKQYIFLSWIQFYLAISLKKIILAFHTYSQCSSINNVHRVMS